MARRLLGESRGGDMTVQEAGRKGGEATSRTHGREFYQEIGRKGGETTSSTHGREFYQEIGQRGGQRVRELINRGKGLE
jgi:uncharacterized protein